MLRCVLQCRTRIYSQQLPRVISAKRASYVNSAKENDANPDPGPSPEPRWNPPPLPELKLKDKRTVVIKGWAPFKNMAEVLAVIREVESKFGSFVEYQAIRDYEMPDKYFGLIFAAFQDPQALKAIPPAGLEMAATAPPSRFNNPGTFLGWNDVERYLTPRDRDPKYVDKLGRKTTKNEKKLLHFRVAPSKKELDTSPPATPKPKPNLERQAAVDFLEWGRLIPLHPISSERVITDEEISEGSDLDHVRLRAALRWAARAVGVRSPHELYQDDDQVVRSVPSAPAKPLTPENQIPDESPTSKLKALFERKKLGPQNV